jgi:hypothetical protein
MFGEMLTFMLSSAGLTGGLVAAVTKIALKKAKEDAEIKRKERLKLEILRLEGEEKMSALLFAMLRYARGGGCKKELDEAENAYIEHLENSKRLKNEIIGIHTSD